MRPLMFWGLVAGAIFVAMAVLWAFSDEEPTGAVFVISTILFWVSGLALIGLGLLALSRWRRPSASARRERRPDGA